MGGQEAGGGGGAGGPPPGRVSAESVDEEEIRRVARLMKIDIGAGGGEEARAHIDKVRTMIGYFDMLDRAGTGGAGAGAAGVGGGPAAGGACRAARLGDLREDEPEEGGGQPAGRYARVQREGGTYVRAPALSA